MTSHQTSGFKRSRSLLDEAVGTTEDPTNDNVKRLKNLDGDSVTSQCQKNKQPFIPTLNALLEDPEEPPHDSYALLRSADPWYATTSTEKKDIREGTSFKNTHSEYGHLSHNGIPWCDTNMVYNNIRFLVEFDKAGISDDEIMLRTLSSESIPMSTFLTTEISFCYRKITSSITGKNTIPASEPLHPERFIHIVEFAFEIMWRHCAYDTHTYKKMVHTTTASCDVNCPCSHCTYKMFSYLYVQHFVEDPSMSHKRTTITIRDMLFGFLFNEKDMSLCEKAPSLFTLSQNETLSATFMFACLVRMYNMNYVNKGATKKSSPILQVVILYCMKTIQVVCPSIFPISLTTVQVPESLEKQCFAYIYRMYHVITNKLTFIHRGQTSSKSLNVSQTFSSDMENTCVSNEDLFA